MLSDYEVLAISKIGLIMLMLFLWGANRAYRFARENRITFQKSPSEMPLEWHADLLPIHERENNDGRHDPFRMPLE